jgi:hypothetical protein
MGEMFSCHNRGQGVTKHKHKLWLMARKRRDDGVESTEVATSYTENESEFRAWVSAIRRTNSLVRRLR